MSREFVEILNLFNEKADKLMRSRFTRIITDPDIEMSVSTLISVDASGNPIATYEVVGPDEDNIDAFVLTFRFFIQSNDVISFANMQKAYDCSQVDQEIKNSFTSLRNKINFYLDGKTQYTIQLNDDILSRRDIMMIFIYGGLSHANNRVLKFKYETLTKSAFRGFFEQQFVVILSDLLIAINDMRNINERALIDLRNNA